MNNQGMGAAATHCGLARGAGVAISGAESGWRCARALAAMLVVVALVSACAMTPNGRGGMLMSVDTAGLFGTEAGKFALNDGSEATLRRDTSGAYSVKLDRYMRVTPLPNAITARIARVETIGQRTVVVIETQERNCAYKYEVLSISGSDVLQWKLGNCVDRPRVEKSADGQMLTLDFPNYNRLTRNIYTDSRMLTSTIPAPAGTDLQSKPFADQALRAPMPASGEGSSAGGRFVPAPPQADTTLQSRPAPAAARNTRTSRASATPASSPAQRSQRTPAPAPLNFPTEEVAPIRIDLRK